MNRPDPHATVAQHWGADAPDWVRALADHVSMTSQGKVADRIGYTGSVISQILRNNYRAGLDKIELAVRGAFMDGKVVCPELGELDGSQCVAHQRRARSFQNTNGFRIRMFRACRRCPRFTGKEASDV